jgi:predicted enzyme related to lactoylglutathione lyase
MNQEVKPKFIGTVIFVEDVNSSKKFYNEILEQEIEMDFGQNVSFIGGHSIWDGKYAHEITGLNNPSKDSWGKGNLEVYFETEDLDSLQLKCKERNVEFIHEIIEQPWGQRCFRVYDPDHHIVEFGEPMHIVVRRFHNEGMNSDDISKKTLMPLDIVKKIIE